MFNRIHFNGFAWCVVLGWIFLLAQASPLFAFRQPVHRELPNIDQRLKAREKQGKKVVKHPEAAARLQRQIPRLRIDRDAISGAPRSIASVDSFLTGPRGIGKGAPLRYDRSLAPEDPHFPIKAFAEEHADWLGFGAAEISRAKLQTDYSTPHNGLRTIVWGQHLDALPIYEGVLVGHITREGELVNLSSGFLAEPQNAATAGTPNFMDLLTAPPISARRAVVLAAEALEEKVLLETVVPQEVPLGAAEPAQHFKAGALPETAKVSRVWFPLAAERLRLCWQVELTRHAGNERYRVVIDLETGDVLLRRCLTVYLTEASYRVYTGDSPSPFSPGHAIPSTNQPPFVERQLLTLAALNTNASPLGWIHASENETRGNNVDAHLDHNADNVPDLPRPHGSPHRVFDFPMDLGQSPTTYGDAAAVQLFYWCNWMHDQLYELGFTEAAGNFQKDNLGRGGLGGDHLLADAQDGSGFNNANYTPTRDGVSPRIQMFLFNGPEPWRDGSLDAEIVLHEYTHGLTDRLVGGGVGIGAFQTYGLGEGWSDWYALALLSEPADDPDAAYAVGGFATWQFYGLAENYYYGIRRYPYSTDLTVNPLTFKDIDPSRASAHEGVPVNPLFQGSNPAEVHNQGEVWCAALWEVRANLIRKHGFEKGSRLALLLVTDGLKLSPANPNFLQARDAIILADLVNNGGENYNDLWAAFAKRGMGFSALAPISSTTMGVIEAYDLPDALLISHTGGLTFTGPASGPFLPECKTFVVTNHTAEPVDWIFQTDVAWLGLSARGGQLEPATDAAVTVCVNDAANGLPLGIHVASLQFSNVTTGVLQSREIKLRVLGFTGLPFAEDFENGVLAPYWNVSGIGPFQTQVTSDFEPYRGSHHVVMDSWAAGVSARNELTLGLDLAGYASVWLSFWARDFADEPHFAPPGPFFDGADFDGVAISEDGLLWYEVKNLVSLGGTNTEFLVDLDAAVMHYGLHYNHNFQIRFNQYDNNYVPFDGLALDDIQVTGVPARRFAVSLPARVSEGDGALSGVAQVSLGAAVSEDLVLRLTASDETQLGLPETVTIPAGSSAVSFNLTVEDDTLIDGTQSVSVTASAPDYVSGSAVLQVMDNEVARLELRLRPFGREGAQSDRWPGIVRVNPPPDRDIAVQLTSSDPTELRVPETVTIPAGHRQAVFEFTLVDDLDLEGPHRVSVTAQVDNWIAGQDSILIRDNDRRRLSVTLPSKLSEGNGLLAKAGLVRVEARQDSDLLVHLKSSAPDELAVPDTVTIPAGQFTAVFDLDVKDDDVIDGAKEVIVIAAAKRYFKGTGTTWLLDDEIPLAPFQPQPANGAQELALDMWLAWSSGVGEAVVNGDFESGDFTGWRLVNGGLGSFVINDGTYDPEGPDGKLPPFGGDYSALSEQIGGGGHEIRQDVVIPAEAKSVSLSWADRIRNHAARFVHPSQEFRMEIRDTNNVVLEVIYQTQLGDDLRTDWADRSYDITRYRDQAIRLAFVELDSLSYFNLHLDNVSVWLGESAPTTYRVYFGSQPDLGPEHLLGATSNAFWQLPKLDLETTYYWRVAAQRGDAITEGPVWQFKTRGIGELERLQWSAMDQSQYANQPFPATLTAIDDIGNAVADYEGSVSLQVLPEAGTRSAVVVTEIDSGLVDRIELVNASERWLDLTDWQITTYDAFSWPEPRSLFVVPTNTFSAPGELFVLQRLGEAPGVYPQFYTGTNLYWNQWAVSNQIAVLVQDAESNVVDFICAVDAFPGMITNPIAIPRDVWNGNPIAGNTNRAFTYQRIGSADHDNAGDWIARENNLGELAEDLFLPLTNAAPLVVEPAILANFQNGIWQGLLTLPQISERVTLLADDGQGHLAFSDPFSLRAAQDLALIMSDHPDLPYAGDDLVYWLRITNSGPDAVTEVGLTDSLPESVEFVKATPSQGECAYADGQVVCALGTIAGGAAAEVSLTVRPLAAGTITNQASLNLRVLDGYAANNFATEVTTVNLPWLICKPVLAYEGDEGTSEATFTVSLSAPSRLPVGIRFETADLSAQAGIDYLPVATNLVFAPGTVRQQVQVLVLGDRLSEASERFQILLLNPSNATIPDQLIMCAILDNDPLPFLSIGDVALVEGPMGHFTNAVFRIGLSESSASPVSVLFETQPGIVDSTMDVPSPVLTNRNALDAATEHEDFIPQTGTITFPPGSTNETIQISVHGDRNYEANEVFSVVLSKPVSANLFKDVGIGLIVDDDAGELGRYEINTIPSPRYAGVPFPIIVTARDGLNLTVTNFTDSIRLSGFPAREEVVVGEGEIEWEFPVNTEFHDGRLQVIYPAETINQAGAISALSLNLATPPGQMLGQWTIRMKHTPQTHYVQPAWDTEGWIPVLSKDLVLVEAGWHVFWLETPFRYNGTDSLMVDFSFNNSSYSADGLCVFTPTPLMRSTYFETDSAFGDPLTWNVTNSPLPLGTNMAPNIRLLIGEAILPAPARIGPFAEGLWMGDITIAEPVHSLYLRVYDAEEREGISQPFTVESGEDTDTDGLPDAWELRYFGSLNSPGGGLDEDPDHDSKVNLEEMRRGSHPRLTEGLLRITSVTLTNSDVRLRFPTDINRCYRVEWTKELNSTAWFPVIEDVVGNGGEVEVRDSGGAAQPRRFYRVLAPEVQP